MRDQDTQNFGVLHRRTVFHDYLTKAARSTAEKTPQDLDRVIHIGEMKQTLADTYRQLEDIELWFSTTGRGWLSFLRFTAKSHKRTERVLAITLFNLLVDELGMSHYDVFNS